jgi:IS5 family transposase
MKRRAAVEPSIGHLKTEHRLERNRLKGVGGDAINAILSAASMNFQKLMRTAGGLFERKIFELLSPLQSLLNSSGQLITIELPPSVSPRK